MSKGRFSGQDPAREKPLSYYVKHDITTSEKCKDVFTFHISRFSFILQPYFQLLTPETSVKDVFMKKRPYEKYIYWVTPETEACLRDDLAARGIRLKSAKGVVCTPLDEINRVSSVAPEVWGDTCRRQGSWYRSSDRNGLFLIVSSFAIEGYEEHLSGRIIRSDFKPPSYAGREEMETMVADPAFVKSVPLEWPRAETTEKRIQVRWARRLGAVMDDYDDLFLVHTANHANFMRPRFFVREGGCVIPYSIERSAHLCSCCLELFQVVGAEYSRKLVAPCPGAAIFARLEPDAFLLAERVQERTP